MPPTCSYGMSDHATARFCHPVTKYPKEGRAQGTCFNQCQFRFKYVVISPTPQYQSKIPSSKALNPSYNGLHKKSGLRWYMTSLVAQQVLLKHDEMLKDKGVGFKAPV